MRQKIWLNVGGLGIRVTPRHWIEISFLLPLQHLRIHLCPVVRLNMLPVLQIRQLSHFRPYPPYLVVVRLLTRRLPHLGQPPRILLDVLRLPGELR